MNTTDTSAMRPLLFPDDQQFWYETLRALAAGARRRPLPALWRRSGASGAAVVNLS
jgi:hypothetical protein